MQPGTCAIHCPAMSAQVEDHVAAAESYLVSDVHTFRASLGYELAKRAFDIVVATLLLVLLLPILVVIGLLVVLDSRGPVLFRQTRVGRGQRTFVCLKFRTMVWGADEKPHHERLKHLIANADRVIADPIPEDPRVTRIGRRLRRAGLDELPQLWNVIVGDMSLVGPRPPLPYEVEQYAPWHAERLTVRPGITGHWQVYGRHKTTFDESCRMDIEYIRRRTLLRDIWLLLLTPIAILSRWSIG